MFLVSRFAGMDFTQILISILIQLPAVFIAITFHEVAHGWMANICGDPTARMMGRLTLNPAKHFDLIGTLSMLLLGFGWAKPVPFNPNNFKNLKAGTILVALAGPFANLILAFLSFFLYAGLTLWSAFAGIENEILNILCEMIFAIYSLDLGLMVFNLFPIPPLDGSKVLFALLPQKAYRFVLTYEKYGMIIMLVLIVTGILTVPMNYIISWFNQLFVQMLNLVLHLFM